MQMHAADAELTGFVYRHVCRHVYRHVYGPVYGQVHRHVYRYLHRHVRRHVRTEAIQVHATDAEVAGFARTAGNFTFVMVRSAGHIVPHDQPARALDIMERMLSGRPFD